MIDVSYRIEAEGAIQDLRYAQRKVSLHAQKGLRRGVRDIAVPRARSTAPHQTGKYAAQMRPAVKGLTGFIENRDPRAGLLEFGGVRRDHINPGFGKQAVTPAPGVAVRYVKTPRRYKGQHSIQQAAEASATEIGEITRDAIVEAFATYFPVT